MIQKPEFEDKKTVNNYDCYGDDRPNQCKEDNNQPGSIPVWNNGFGTGQTKIPDLSSYGIPTNSPNYFNTYTYEHPSRWAYGYGCPTKSMTNEKSVYDYNINLTSDQFETVNFSSPLYNIDIDLYVLEKYASIENVNNLKKVRTYLDITIRQLHEFDKNTGNVRICNDDLNNHSKNTIFINDIAKQLCVTFRFDWSDLMYFKDSKSLGYIIWEIIGRIIDKLNSIIEERNVSKPKESTDKTINNLLDKTGEPIIPRVNIDEFLENRKKENEKAETSTVEDDDDFGM